MKLSNREKVLIFILLIVVVGYVGYTFIPFDKLFNLDELEQEYNLKKSEYDTMSQNILMKQTYETKSQELSDEINNYRFLSVVKQENVIVFLNKYLSNNNIEANDISFTDETVVTVDASVKESQLKPKSTFETMMDGIKADNVSNPITPSEEADKEGTEQNDKGEVSNEATQEAKSALTTKVMTVNVAFQCTYDNLLKFIDAIQNHQYEITITNINTLSVASETGNNINGSMELNFYEVPKLDSFIEKNIDWTW